MIAKFRAAVPGFLEALSATIEADIARYRKDFPDDAVQSSYFQGKIEITSSVYKPEITAIVEANPDILSISFACDYCKPTHWEQILRVSELGLHTADVDQNRTVRDLSRKILRPILFPAL